MVSTQRSTGEMAQLLKEYGANIAMKLDAGGSSQLWYRGRALLDSDRGVANALLVFVENRPRHAAELIALAGLAWDDCGLSQETPVAHGTLAPAFRAHVPIIFFTGSLSRVTRTASESVDAVLEKHEGPRGLTAVLNRLIEAKQTPVRRFPRYRVRLPFILLLLPRLTVRRTVLSLLLVIFGYAITFDIDNIPAVVVDLDKLTSAASPEPPLQPAAATSSAAIDAEGEHELFGRFQALAADRTAIVISHRFSTVRLADRIAVLHGGRIEEIGSHKELVARGGRYAHLFGLQAAGYLD